MAEREMPIALAASAGLPVADHCRISSRVGAEVLTRDPKKGELLKVTQIRVLVDYRVVVEPPKSRNGFRALPLDDEIVAGLKALRKRQADEAYGDGEYVVTDEVAAPVHPEWYSEEVRADPPVGEVAQDHADVVSEIFGHGSIAITKDVYGHLAEEDRRAAATS